LDDVTCRQKTSLKRRHKDAVQWRKETPFSGAMKVDKVDIKKDGQLLPCLIVYSLKQKERERVAHCLSVFYIEIFDFDKL
jgi:hypothetical protein